MDAAREGSGTSVSQPHALEEVGEHFSNQYVPHTSGSEVGNHQAVRVGSHPHMSRGTQAMNPPFQQMAEFFHHMAKSMNDPNKINFEKNEENGWSGLVSAAFTWEQLDKEEASRNENKFRKPRPDFGGLSKRGRFDDSKAGSVNGPPQQKQIISEFSSVQLALQIMAKASLAFLHVNNVERITMAFAGELLVHVSIVGALIIKGARPKTTQAAGASGANKASGPRTTAGAYAMRQRDDQDGQDVVIGKFYLFGLCVFTLFDPGSTHSYLCSSLVLPENVKFVSLNYDVLFGSPLGLSGCV
uniref:Uncharacterized protein n=1 Tax=Solanum tuberosum TaxID=4113 RepID=M1DD81_SOLTU